MYNRFTNRFGRTPPTIEGDWKQCESVQGNKKKRNEIRYGEMAY